MVDLEIQRTAELLPNGWSDIHLMGVACAIAYEHVKQTDSVYTVRMMWHRFGVGSSQGIGLQDSVFSDPISR